MPRPKCCRWVFSNPSVTFFKPRGVPMAALERVVLTLDELEAMRLADCERLYHGQAATRMRVSRATFGRILDAAHRKVTDALLNGKALEFKQASGVEHIVHYGKEKDMKLAVTALGTNLDADVDDRFGRCRYFVIVDPATMDAEAVENEAESAGGGAGIRAAELLTGRGVGAVLTGNCGPNAFATLEAAGVRVFTGISGKVRDAVEAYKKGGLAPAQGPSSSSHAGMRRS